jgi:hypothetical protein
VNVFSPAHLILETDQEGVIREGDLLRCEAGDAYVTLKPFTGTPPRNLIMRLKPLSPFDQQAFVMEYLPAAEPDARFGHRFPNPYLTRGTAQSKGSELQVEWTFPMAVRQCRLVMPAGASFRLLSFETFDAPPSPFLAGILLAAKLLAVGLLVAAVLLLVQASRPGLALGMAQAKNLILLFLIPLQVLVIFLLPPFQGPDEYRHWKAALAQFRRNPLQEIPLYNLHEVLETQDLVFHAENQLPAQRLRRDHGNRLPEEKPMRISYGTLFSYPVVGVVALAFPRVETVNEALVFYYLCRLIPAGLLDLLLYLANRRRQLPFLALAFFALPYVIQQYTVISTDTAAILGTLAAVLVYLSLVDRPGGWRLALLILLCLVVLLAKPPFLAGIFSLPLLRVPYRRVASKKVLVVAGILLLALILAGAYIGLDRLRSSGEEEAANINAQLQSLTTAEGIQGFTEACLGILSYKASGLETWFHPLGWLDTTLSQEHVLLLFTLIAVAMALDLVHVAPALPRVFLERKASALVHLAVILGNFLFIGLSACLVMFVLYTRVGEVTISGVQTRYFFPAAELALFLPLAVLLSSRLPEDCIPGIGKARLLPVLALGLLPLLFLAEGVQLAIDLLARYW